MPDRKPQITTTEKRKQDHVEICTVEEVDYATKSTGFGSYQFVHNALPELNFDEIDLSVSFLDRPLNLPLMITGMSGGYTQAYKINAGLAEVCEQQQIAMGLGSMRQALENKRHWPTYKVARDNAPGIPLLGNIGAAQITDRKYFKPLANLLEHIRADALAVHLNALQEVVQPEGEPHFKGVLKGIERLVKYLDIPILVKETGAGISAEVARRLKSVGVRYVDVSGAGGTSWAAVESFRGNPKGQKAKTRAQSRILAKTFWNWGIPTAECVRALADIKGIYTIASGGIRNGIDVAKSIALGARLAGMAKTLLKILQRDGQFGLAEELHSIGEEIRTVMFLTGSRNVRQLRHAHLNRTVPADQKPK